MIKKQFFFLYALIILAITVTLATMPDYNWDMLPYMAVLEKIDGVKSFNQIHDDVYTTAEKNIPADKYQLLVDPNNRYRKKMAENAAAFKTQLPFFNIKPVYLIAAFVFYKIGISLTYATVLPSLIAFYFINLVSFFWCKNFLLPAKTFFLLLFLICVITIPLAVRSNPDTLSCLFLLIASFIFLEYEKLFLTVLFLLLSILTRPDNIIFAFLLYAIIAAGWWKKKIPLYVSALCLLALTLAYYLPVKLMSNPGWSTLFYHAFIDNTADPSIKQTITAPVYLQVINRNVLNIKGYIGILFISFLSFFVYKLKIKQSKKTVLYKLFYLAVIIWIIFKFLLFPMLGLRFIIPPFLLLFFVMIKEYESIFLKNGTANIYNQKV